MSHPNENEELYKHIEIFIRNIKFQTEIDIITKLFKSAGKPSPYVDQSNLDIYETTTIDGYNRSYSLLKEYYDSMREKPKSHIESYILKMFRKYAIIAIAKDNGMYDLTHGKKKYRNLLEIQREFVIDLEYYHINEENRKTHICYPIKPKRQFTIYYINYAHMNNIPNLLAPVIADYDFYMQESLDLVALAKIDETRKKQEEQAAKLKQICDRLLEMTSDANILKEIQDISESI